MANNKVEYDFTSDGDLELYGDNDLCFALLDERFPNFEGNVYVNDRLVN